MRNPDAYVPMPDSAHPSFTEEEARDLRTLLERVESPSFTLIDERRTPGPPQGSDDRGWPLPIPTITFKIRKCAGPMPYVADPRVTQFWYVWKVATDPAGRYIAGPAEIAFRRVGPKV